MRHTVKHIALLILFAFCTMAVQAQGTMEKLKFEEAEKDFENQRYIDCANKLEELESKGLKNPKVLYLKIKAKSYLVVGLYRYDKIYQGFKTVDGLRKDCNNYLAKYDIEGLEDKYKEVYNISSQLNHHPKTQQEWNTKVKSILSAEKQYKDKIIQDFCNNLVKVEKGTFYRGTIDRYYLFGKGGTISSRGDRLTDEEIIEYNKKNKSKGLIQKAIEVDYNFYVVNQHFTEDVLWAILDGTKGFYYVNYNNEDDLRLDLLKEKQGGNQFISLATKDGYPKFPKEELRLSYENFLYFIQMLNRKTGKKFRLMTEIEWEYAQRGGHKQQLDTIVDKKIIGGNKRKGYEYEITNYYSYKSSYIYPCNSYGEFKYSKTSNCNEKPNELGLIIKDNVFCTGRMDKEKYDSFSGKASDVTIEGKEKFILKKWFSYKRYPSDNDELPISDEEIRSNVFSYALVLDEN